MLNYQRVKPFELMGLLEAVSSVWHRLQGGINGRPSLSDRIYHSIFHTKFEWTLPFLFMVILWLSIGYDYYLSMVVR